MALAAIWIVKGANGYKPQAEFQANTDEDDPHIFPENLHGTITDLAGSDAVAAMDADLKRRARRQLLSTPSCKAHF